MRDARTIMLSGAFVLVVAALGSGWILTRRALMPVAAVTDAARHIAETGRFDRRLSVGPPRDELTALAATFDVMIARVEQIVVQQRQFLADTSHELRNPLSVIRGNLDFVRRVTTDQSCLESIHEAEVEVVRMSRLVNDLLLLGQADRGEFIERRPFQLDLLLQEIVEQAQQFSAGQVVALDDSAEVWLLGDRDRLRQAFWNLVENALRHTPSNGQIDLRMWLAGDEVVIDVADSGPGVSSGHEDRVFERFYRADPSRARATGGAGLGLAIVKHIVQGHGGTVTLRNRPGHGATFSVRLSPVVPTPLATRQPEHRPPPDSVVAHAG
jgi:signal transduction histidine kinase